MPQTLPTPPLRAALRTLLSAALLACALLLALPALTALAATPAQDAPTNARIFQSNVLPSASSPGRVITLAFDAAGNATLTTDYQNGEDPIVETGTYAAEGDIVALTLSGRADRTYETPVEIIFSVQDDGALVATTYDESLYGSEGFTLYPAAGDAPPAGEGSAAPAASAPVAAAITDATGLAGTYASGTLPAADTPGMVMTVTLNADGTARVSTDYLNDKPPFEEVGKWVDNGDDTATLTITGEATRTYDAPQVIELEVLADGTLHTTAPDFFDGEGITFTRQADSAAGVYASKILPAADSPGMVVFMILYENGNVQASTYYLNEEAPVQEIGAWAANVDGSVTVTVTASAERTYDQPQQLVFQRSGSTLSFLSLELTRIETASVNTGPTPTAWYQSDVTPAASSPGMQRSLILYDDNSARMITDYMNDEAPITEVGDFIDNDDGTLTLTLTGTPERVYGDGPILITFERQGDQLVAIEYDETRYGSEGITLTEQPLDDLPADETASAAAAPAAGALAGSEALTATATLTAPAAAPAEATATAPTTSTFEPPSGAVAVYASDVLPAASSPGRQMRLVLFSDNSAQMITDYMNGEEPVTELGTWSEDDSGLTVTLKGRITSVYAEPVEIIFARTADGLEATQYDEAIYGADGITLTTEYTAE